MADDDSIVAFFRYLATRCCQELHLSDVTYAMLEAVPEFKKDFVHFFYPDLPVEEEIEVLRECVLPTGGGQPDFLFRAPSWRLIVENKLDDPHHHFEQYSGADPNARLGLIANHQVQQGPNNVRWRLRSWVEFIDQFEHKVYPGAAALFSGYLRYIREVCGMRELSAFSLEPAALSSLRRFNDMLADVIERTRIDGCSVCIRSDFYNFGRSWSGSYVDLTTGSDARVTAFFGVDYRSEVPFIGVSVEQEDPSYPQVVAHLVTSLSFTVERDTLDGGRVWLKMSRAQWERLNGAADVGEQRQILADFFTNCCTALVRVLVA
jgi:hypothetical protein